MTFFLPAVNRAWRGSAIAIAIVVGCPALAQLPPEQGQPYQGSEPASSSMFVGGYGGGWGGGYHSSTAAEGYLQGMSSVINAQGQANLNNSMAARNMQEAYNRALDNRVKQVETYRWRRDTALERQRQELSARRQESEARLSKRRLTDLTPNEFDPASGAVNWPALLREPAYDEYRERLDELMAKRAQYGALSMQEYTDAVTTIKDWRMAVTAVRKNYPYNAVGQALRFLLRLDREVDSQMG